MEQFLLFYGILFFYIYRLCDIGPSTDSFTTIFSWNFNLHGGEKNWGISLLMDCD